MNQYYTFFKRSVLIPAAVLLVLAGAITSGRFLLANLVVQSLAIPFAENSLPGLDLSIKSVSTDLISSIEFNNITVRFRLDDGSLLNAKLPRVHVDFSLFDLRENFSTFIRNARIQATIKDAAIELVQSESDTSTSFKIDFPAIAIPLPSCVMKYENVLITQADKTVRLTSGELAVSPQHIGQQSSVLPIDFTAGRIDFSFGSYKNTAEEVQVESYYRSGSFEVAFLNVGRKELARTVIFTSDDGNLSVKALLTFWDGILDLEAEIAEQVSIKFTTSGFNLSKIDLASVDEGISKVGILEGKGVLSFPVEEPLLMTGELFFSLKNGVFFEVPVETFRLHATCANGMLQIDELLLESQKDQLHIEQTILPLEPIFSGDWFELLSKAAGHFAFSIENIGKYKDQLPEAANELRKQYKVVALKANGKLTRGVFDVPLFLLNSEKVSIRADYIGSDLNPWIKEKVWQKIPIKGEIVIDSKDTDFLAEILPDYLHFSGKLSAVLTFDGEIGEPSVLFSVKGQKIIYKNIALDFVQIDGSHRHKEIILDSIRVENGQDRLQGAFRYQFMTPSNDFSGSLEIKVAEIYNYFPGSITLQNQVKGDLSGRFGFGSVNEILTGDAFLSSDSLSYTGQTFEQINVDAHLSNNDITITAFKGSYPSQKLSVTSGNANISFNSQWDQFQVHLNNFSATYDDKIVELLHSAQLRYAAGKTTIETPLTFQFENERVSFAGVVATEIVDLEIDAEIEAGTRFMKAFGDSGFTFETFSMKAGVKGSIYDPVINLSGIVKQIKAKDVPPLDGVFSVFCADDKLKIKQFILSDGISPRLQMQGEFPLSIKDWQLVFLDGPLHLSGDIDLESSPLLIWLLQDKIDHVGAVRGEIDIHGTRKNPLGTLQIRADELLLKDGSGWLPDESITARISVKAEKNTITLEKSTFVSASASLSLQGTASAMDFFTNDFLLGGDESVSYTAIDFKGGLTLKEIDWLAGRHDLLRRISGEVEADFKITGTISEPLINGSLSLQKGEMRLSNDMPTLQEVTLHAQLADSTVIINQFSGTLGGAPLEAQGKIALPAADGVVAMDLKVSGKDLLFYRAEGVKFRGDALLNIRGSYDRPMINGNITLTDARVTRNIDFVSSLVSGFSARETPPPRFPAFTDPPLRDAVFNLTMTAKEPVFLANNLLRGKLSPNLELHGTGEVPFLSGKLYIVEANFVLPAGKVKMDSGLVQFLETDPDRPVLDLNGTAKMMGYDIVIGISGSYDAPVITLSSTPFLTNEDLLMLLLAGKRPTVNAGQQNQSKNYSSVAVYMGENLFKSLWGTDENDNDTTILDRLQLEIGRNITQQGEETIDAQFVLIENFNKGQNAILLTGEKDVWGKYNGGLRLVFKFR